MLTEVAALPFALARSMHRIMRPHALVNPLLTPTALVTLSASHYPLSSRCLPPAANVAAIPSSLQLLLSLLPPPTLVAPSYRQRYGIAPAFVTVTPRCRSRETLISTSTLVSTAFASRRQPLVERRCRFRSHVAHDARHPPLSSLSSSSSPHHSRHCCLAATPTIAEPTPPGEPSRRHLPVRGQAHLCPISILLIVA